MKKLLLLIAISATCISAFSQEFYYSFQNQEISKFLSDNKIEKAFNIMTCADSFEEYSCGDNYDEIKYVSYLNNYYYKCGKAVYEEVIDKEIKTVKKFYYNSDTIFSVAEYKGDLLWNMKFYNKEGQPYEIGSFKEGNGQLKYYRQNGTIGAIENFKNGKLDGKVVLYYSNGSVMLEGQFKDGEELDEWKEFVIKH